MQMILNKIGLTLLGLWGVLILVFVVQCVGGVSTSSTYHSPAPDASSAYTACQQFVEQQLKAPGTAEWPWGYSQFTTDLGSGRFRISSWVDAHNNFGAKVRTDFECQVKRLSGDTWTLENLTLIAR